MRDSNTHSRVPFSLFLVFPKAKLFYNKKALLFSKALVHTYTNWATNSIFKRYGFRTAQSTSQPHFSNTGLASLLNIKS